MTYYKRSSCQDQDALDAPYCSQAQCVCRLVLPRCRERDALKVYQQEFHPIQIQRGLKKVSQHIYLESRGTINF
jgi:hypothetical protein